MTSAWWCLSPRASKVKRIFHEWPMPLRTCLMLTLPLVMVSFAVFFGPRVLHQTCVLGMYGRLLRLGARAIAKARHLDTTLAGDLLDRREVLQSVQRCQHHVVRIG